MNLAPRRRRPWALPAYLASAVLLVVLLVVALDRGLAAFATRAPWSYVGALALLVALTLTVGLALRLSPLSLAAAAPAVGVALVLVVNAPLPFMLRDMAAHLPRAPGESSASASSGPVAAAGHPLAFLSVAYPADANASAVVNDTASRFQDAGWTLEQVVHPEAQGYGLVVATRAPFLATCAIAPLPSGPSMRCSLTL